MKKIILIIVVLFVGLESLGWWAYKKSATPDKSSPVESSVQFAAPSKTAVQNDAKPARQDNSQQAAASSASTASQAADASQLDASAQQALLGANITKFPYVIVEKQGDLTMRTIHIGVRQWAWDPMTLDANLGEKVNLIIHNADVAHSIVISELGVKTEIPEEGAIVTFMASKRGTFDYYCNTPCGSGHSKMRGKITIT